MDIEALRTYCLSKPGVTESFPFDESTLVFKVMGKMFALTGIEEFAFVNLKCDPEQVEELRSEHDVIQPGYHMSKRHWNSVYPEVGDKLLLKLTDQSYELVVKSLKKAEREELERLS